MGNGERVEEGWGCWEIRVIPGVGSTGLCWGRQLNGHIPDKNIIPHVRERSVKVRSPHGTPRGKLCGLGGLSLCGLWQEVEGGSVGVRSEGGR